MANYDDLNFNVNMAPPRFKPFDGTLRMTECTGCPGAIIHRILGCQSVPLDQQTLAYFHEGYVHEDDVRARLKERGVFIIEYGQAGLKALDVPVVAHPDGYIPANREGLEIKSVGDPSEYEGAQHDITDKHTSWQRQVQSYLRIMNAERMRIIIKSRKTGWIFPPTFIEYDQSVTDPIWGSIQQAIHDVEQARQLQGPSLTCATMSTFLGCASDYATRMFCPFYGVHCQRMAPEIIEGELLKLMTDYAAWKSMVDNEEIELKSIRDKIYAVVKDLGVEKATTEIGTASFVPIKEHDSHVNAYTQFRITIKPKYMNSLKEMIDGSTGQG